MIKKQLYLFLALMLTFTACVKETYDMNKISKEIRYSPTFGMMAATGEITLSDLVKPGDNLVFESDKTLKVIFRMDSVINLKLADFTSLKSIVGFNDKVMVGPANSLLPSDNSKATANQLNATIANDSLNFEIEEILNHITGTFGIVNPSIKINYSNSFPYPVEIDFNVVGKRGNKTEDLNLAPFALQYPAPPASTDVTSTININKSNSSLPQLMSMPPEKIYFSGNVKMNTGSTIILPANNRLIGSLEVEVPLELSMNNLQFSDTIDNFLSPDNSGSSDFSPSDMDYTRLDITVNNWFPVGLKLKMYLYDSFHNDTLKSVRANKFLSPAPVDDKGMSTGSSESITSFEFTQGFFDAAKKADRIIFIFTLNTSAYGSNNIIKIQSDNKISFSAAVVAKPEINLK